LDADDFHPAANVEKMSKGIPLNDEDRMPWLLCLHDELEHRIGSGASVVLGCSALKESYRQIMQEGLSRNDWEKGKITFFPKDCSRANSLPWRDRKTPSLLMPAVPSKR